MSVRIIQGDCLDVLRTLPEGSVQCCISSPPYFGLRSYLDADDPQKAREMGTEPTPDEYVANLVAVFREVRRVLREDGTVWLNLGDSYNSQGTNMPNQAGLHASSCQQMQGKRIGKLVPGLKPKDLCGVPWRVAFALQADGWWLRSEIPWLKRNCLSGGAIVYAWSQKGQMPMTVKDVVRLDPATVKLWNGTKWTQVLAWHESTNTEQPLCLILRSGESIGCTPDHLWPTQRGNVPAGKLRVGDVLQYTKLPEPGDPDVPLHIPDSLGWFVGMYLAEGSHSSDTIQISSHSDEAEGRYERLGKLAMEYGGTCNLYHLGGKTAAIHMHCKLLDAILDLYIRGRTAKDKHLDMRCWRRSDEFLRELLMGYLEGDGHYDAPNRRWRLGFTRNSMLANDLRTLCARLGISLRLRNCFVPYNGHNHPIYRGEIRFDSAPEHDPNSMRFQRRPNTEIVKIERSSARKLWDITVEDDPHTFALASGVLTHNCMPGSQTDRPTTGHEHVFLLTKSARYFWDQDAVRVASIHAGKVVSLGEKSLSRGSQTAQGYDGHWGNGTADSIEVAATRTRRTTDWWFESLGRLIDEERAYLAHLEHVRENGGMLLDEDGNPLALQVNTRPFPGSHFATFPPALVEPCVLAGTSHRGACPACGAPWERVVEQSDTRETHGINRVADNSRGRHGENSVFNTGRVPVTTTLGWQPGCTCDAGDPVPCVVLDPFGGAGTVGLVAQRLERDAVLIELNPDYCAMAERRLRDELGMFAAVTVEA